MGRSRYIFHLLIRTNKGDRVAILIGTTTDAKSNNSYIVTTTLLGCVGLSHFVHVVQGGNLSIQVYYAYYTILQQCTNKLQRKYNKIILYNSIFLDFQLQLLFWHYSDAWWWQKCESNLGQNFAMNQSHSYSDLKTDLLYFYYNVKYNTCIKFIR